ncbi:CHTOP family protein [Megaselia abdita]
MSEISKIHVNNSTRVSLNDRFTAIRSVKPNVRRNDGHLTPRSSEANRKLVQRLSVKHKARPTLKTQKTALKGKAKTVKRQAFPKGITSKPFRPNLRLDFVKTARNTRLLKRSNSTGNITARLGNNNQRVNRRVTGQRSSSQSRGRSRSRNQTDIVQNTRSNSKSRARSTSRARMVNSVNVNSRNVSRGRSASKNRTNANRSSNRNIANRLGVKKAGGNSVNIGRINRRRASAGGQINSIKTAKLNSNRQSRSRTRLTIATKHNWNSNIEAVIVISHHVNLIKTF